MNPPTILGIPRRQEQEVFELDGTDTYRISDGRMERQLDHYNEPNPELVFEDTAQLLPPNTKEEDTIHSDLSILTGPIIDEIENEETTAAYGHDTSYYFPPDLAQPNWRPAVISTPYLLTLTALSIILAVVQEYILRKSILNDGIMSFGSLNDVSVSAYFLWRYFPTIITVLYGVAYQMVDIEVKRLEPFYRLAQKSGATVAQSLNVDSTNFLTWFRPPWPGSIRTILSTLASFTAVAAVPLVQNASLVVRQRPHNEDFSLYVLPIWSRILTSALGFVAVVGTILCGIVIFQSSGLIDDPCGISSVMAMTTKSHVLHDFSKLDGRSTDSDVIRDTRSRKYILHKGSLWQGEYMRNPSLKEPKPTPTCEHPFTLPNYQGFSLFFAILCALALVPILIFTPANKLLDRIPFLMTGLGITVKLLWTLLDTNVRLTEPYYHLLRRHCKPYILASDYTGTLSFSLPFKASRNRHYILTVVAANSILLDVLTVCLSSFGARGNSFFHRKATSPTDHILEGDAETFKSFWISLLLSLSILVSLTLTAIAVYVQRGDVVLPRKPGSLAFVLLNCHQSKMLVDLVDCEELTLSQKLYHMNKQGKLYGLGWYSGRDGEIHCGIDEEPLYASYVSGMAPKITL